MKIESVVGDVRNQPFEDHRIIIHCCNDMGAMGAGVAKALYTKWPAVKARYVHDVELYGQLYLGDVQYVEADDDTTVMNMIGQHSTMVGRDENGTAVASDGYPPVRYWALAHALQKVDSYCRINDGTFELHFPMFGCDLAGGNWDIVSTLIEEAFRDNPKVTRLLLCTIE